MFIKRDLFSKELCFIASSLFIDYLRASTKSRAASDPALNGLVMRETSALSSNIVKQFDKSLPCAAFCPLIAAWVTGQLQFYWPDVFLLPLCAENVKSGHAASQLLFSKQMYTSHVCQVHLPSPKSWRSHSVQMITDPGRKQRSTPCRHVQQNKPSPRTSSVASAEKSAEHWAKIEQTLQCGRWQGRT